MDDARETTGASSRFQVSFDDGPPATVTKRGDDTALAREAQALRFFAGRGGVPRLLAHEPGRLVTERLAGKSRPLTRLSSADAHALGATLRAVHRSVPGTDLCTSTACVAYTRCRVDAAHDLLRQAGFAREVGVPPSAQTLWPIHGDLVAANIIWEPTGPVLIDWEFWRMGDPAEDLAYLIALNDVPERVVEDLAHGYDSPEPWPRVPGWTALVILEAAAWYQLAGDTARATALLGRLGA